MTIESIDNRSDFKTYMQNYAYARGSTPLRGPRRDGPADEGFVSRGHLSIDLTF
jgi:Rho GTPase-activating protein RGD1